MLCEAERAAQAQANGKEVIADASVAAADERSAEGRPGGCPLDRLCASRYVVGQRRIVLENAAQAKDMAETLPSGMRRGLGGFQAAVEHAEGRVTTAGAAEKGAHRCGGRRRYRKLSLSRS